MKKKPVGLMLIFVCAINCCLAQSSGDYNNKALSCQSELSALQGKRNEIDAEYNKVLAELKQGLFCSLCNRSKSQIEKDGTNFYQHIKDVKGNVVQAPQQAYDQAHKEYLSKFNSWQQDVQDKQKSCDNIRSMAQNAAADEQKQIARDNQQRQQVAQEQYQQQQEKVQQQINQAIDDQQAQLQADKLQQQQEFAQSVSNYVNSQSDDIKQRQQAADEIGAQGSILAQSIQGNKIDADKIAPRNLSGSSVFSGAPNLEDLIKSNVPESSNFFEQFSSTVEDMGKDAIVSESNLPETFKNGYEKVNTYLERFEASKDLAGGEVTEKVVNAFFSANEYTSPVITTIRKYSGGVAVKNANSTTDLSNKVAEENISEEDFDKAVQSMNPLHFCPTFVKEQKPFNYKDAAVVVGGGIVLTAIGAPIWLGIGAAAWYGFNR